MQIKQCYLLDTTDATLKQPAQTACMTSLRSDMDGCHTWATADCIQVHWLTPQSPQTAQLHIPNTQTDKEQWERVG